MRVRLLFGLTPVLVAVAWLLSSQTAWAQEYGSNTREFQDALAKGLWLAIGSSFGAGVLASLTPCVFPMVPITVALFGASSASSRSRAFLLSTTFVLGIAACFTPMGVGFALAGKSMGSFLGNTWVVLALAAIFLSLAASMFGAFEMALPASLNNRLAQQGGVGFRGAFVAGVVMGLIAAPCTGPFLTGLLAWISESAARAHQAGASNTSVVAMGAGSMFAFSLGLGVPFFLVGGFAFSLPKGGAWMMGIKWGSGVAFAYLALSYLRDAPQFGLQKFIFPTAHFGYLAILLVLVGLVLGQIHITAERRKSSIARFSTPAKVASILPAVLGLFMLVSWLRTIDPLLAAQLAENSVAEHPVGERSGMVPIIQWGTEEQEALRQASANHKPIVVDFGANWCAACQEIEKKTWPEPRVRKEAARFVALRVDGSNDEDPEYKRLVAKYKVVGLPVVLLLDPNGRELVRFAEFVSADRMLEAMRTVQ